jgi:hypothetical protein
MDRLEVKLCNCAKCGKNVLGESMRYKVGVPEEFYKYDFVAGRIHGRPYCSACMYLREERIRQASKQRWTPREPDPWQENAVKFLEQ